MDPVQRRYFGTDGVRGAYGGPVVNEAFFSRLGAAAARWAGSPGRGAAKVVIGRDTRSSGESLANAFASGLRSQGASAFLLGVVPTPAVSRAASHGGAALGVSITASHNPSADNGIKFFNALGAKLTDLEEARIEALIGDAPAPGPTEGGPAIPHESVLDAYTEAASRILPPNGLAGWPIVIDTANGATCVSSPRVFRALGAELTLLGNAPDGRNINEGVGSEHPERLAQAVLRQGARLGVAHDGDGDRCVVCDELGSVLDGDEVLAVLATHALLRGRLAARTLVVTVQSNLGLDAVVAAAGGRVVRTPVGDRYVAEAMRSIGASLGGESSGHIICSDLSPTGDGLAAALRVAAVMAETGRPLSALRRVLRRAPQAALALSVREKRPLEGLAALRLAMAALEAELGSAGRILVRFSGTETKLRLLVEGPSEAVVRSGMERLVAAARSDLEVL
jgi:phosphoglucosamine mutase